MKRTIIPGTKLEASRLGFGTSGLHHVAGNRQRAALVHEALDCGISHFDTAPMYAEGITERLLGRCLPRNDRITIATKFGLPPMGLVRRFPSLLYPAKAAAGIAGKLGVRPARQRDLSLKGVERSLHDSLSRLGRESIDLWLLHEPQPQDAQAVDRLVPWLMRKRDNGTVRYLGLAGSAQECLAVADVFPGLFDVLQVEDSIAGCEADALAGSGRDLQITFGYLRRGQMSDDPATPAECIGKALQRNSHGTVLFSTKNRDHLAEIAALAQS